MAKRKCIYVGSVPFYGRTIKECKEQRDQYLSDLLSNSMAPAIELTDGHGFVVWRSAYGWEYTIITQGHVGSPVHCGCSTRYKAESRARLHVAQNVYSPGNGVALSKAIGWLESGCVTAENRAEFDSWVQWQERYHKAKLNGSDDNECRMYADNR